MPIIPLKSHQNRGKKLYYLLNRTPSAELKLFRKYLRSPLFGASPQFEGILDLFLKKVLGNGPEAIQSGLFHQQWFPGEKLTPKKEKYIWIRLVQFQKAFLDFVALRQFMDRPALQERFILKSGIKWGWNRYLPGMYQKALNQLSIGNRSHPLSEYLDLEMIWNDYLASQASGGEDTHLSVVLETLDLYFIEQKMKYACAALQSELFFSQKQEILWLDQILELLEDEDASASQTAFGFRHAYLMLKNSSENPEKAMGHYLGVRAYLEEQQHFRHDDIMALFIYAQNFCIRQYLAGKAGFLEKLKSLYDLMIQNEGLLEGGLLSRRVFKNIVNVLCRFGEFVYAEEFIGEYKDRIANDVHGLAFLFNQAVVRFHQQDYKAVVGLLYNDIGRFEDVFYGLGARVYLCRSLWEQQEYEWLQTALEAFRQYLRRTDDIEEGYRKAYNKFIRYVKRMNQAIQDRPDRLRQSLEKVRLQIETAGDEQNYPWVYNSLGAALEEKGRNSAG